jgi:hypothetical protein
MIVLRDKLFGSDAENKYVDPSAGVAAAGGVY